MQINIYLNFNGTCEEALKTYENIFGGKITTMMTYADTQAAAQVPADWQRKILHARLEASGQILMASDVPPGHYQEPRGIHISINLDQPEEADRIFHALADRGMVQMAIEKTFWARRFGMLVDRFGIPWMINCE